jgi:hypothetical protein
MPEAYWSPELHDERAGTTYPLAGPAPITSDDRLVTLEPGTFLDATVHPVGGGAGLRITRVDVEPGVVRLVIGTQALPDLGAATFDPFDPPDRLELTDGYGRAAGLLLCDPGLLAAAQGWPAGVHPFRAGRSEFVATCTIPVPEAGLVGLVVGGAVVAGDVWLVGDAGIVVRFEDGAIRLDAVGDPLHRRRACAEEGGFPTPRFVRTIAGIPPDEHGNWQVSVGDRDATDTILRVVPVPPDGLKIEAVGKPIA